MDQKKSSLRPQLVVFVVLEDTTIATTSLSLSSSLNSTTVEPDRNFEATTGHTSKFDYPEHKKSKNAIASP